MLIINFEIEIFQLVEARKKKKTLLATVLLSIFSCNRTQSANARSLTLHAANSFFAHTIRIMITSYAYRLTSRLTYAWAHFSELNWRKKNSLKDPCMEPKWARRLLPFLCIRLPSGEFLISVVDAFFLFSTCFKRKCTYKMQCRQLNNAKKNVILNKRLTRLDRLVKYMHFISYYALRFFVNELAHGLAIVGWPAHSL